MASPELVALLRRDVDEFNALRRRNPQLQCNLSEAYLVGADLIRANLRGANLAQASLRSAHLTGADLVGANLAGATLISANLIRADLARAIFVRADLTGANLTGVDLTAANFRSANLTSTNLTGTNLTGAILIDAKVDGTKFSKASLGYSLLGALDLRKAKGLDEVVHEGPSTVGMDTIIKSKGEIPEIFLRVCGVSDIFIQYIGSLTNQPIQYYSCFISYSTKDQDFAQRLYNDLQANNVRCWFAPHNIQDGKKLHEQIDEAIRVYDKLLLILSAHSMDSEWVKTEIAKALKRGRQEKRKMLFPVRLVEYNTLQNWQCFDADAGKDSAREIREYFIPDFSAWKADHDKYQDELKKLLRDLKEE